MATLVERGGRYYLQFYDSGRRPKTKRISLGRVSKKVAERLKHRLSDQFALGEIDPWEKLRDESVGECVLAFLESRGNLASSSQQSYRDILRLFQRHLGDTLPMRRVSADDLASFLDNSDRGDVTKSRYLRHLSVFFNFAVKRGVADENVTRGVRLRKIPSKFPQFLTVDQVKELCDEILRDACENPAMTSGDPTWLVPIIRCNVHLGLRLSELCNLRWRDVDLDRHVLVVRHSENFVTKSGKERTLPLSDAVLGELFVLDRACEFVFTTSGNAGRINPGYLSRKFTKYARRVGLAEATFHTLRHTACSWLARRGVSIEAIRLFAGHSSVVVTQKYMHLAGNDFHDMIRRGFN